LDFIEAQNYLLSLGNEVSAMKLGLDNIRTLLGELADPQNGYFKVQVAGTNGKGSVCAFLDSICIEAGIRTGLYSSPHLLSITERIRIDGEDIGRNEFACLATRVRKVSEDLVRRDVLESVPTFFEQITAIALMAFAEAHVELAILETGLGGRLDATTAADAQIAAITRIDHDHQQYLGESLPEIAAEKAAIIRPGSGVIVGLQPDEAMAVIQKVCRAKGVVPRYAESITLPTDRLGLRGVHQQENARIATALAEELGSHFRITPHAIAHGLEQARHAGRLEYDGRFLFDGAHNPGGAEALAKFVRDHEKRPITLIFGCMQDKNVGQIARIIFPLAEKIIVTQPNNTRATPVEYLLSIAELIGEVSVDSSRFVADAISRAYRATPEGGIILVTCSLYLIGEVKQLMRSSSDTAPI